MRIVFITNNYTPYSGGVVSSINATVDALHNAGHEVFIITLDFLGKEHKNDPYFVYRIPSLLRFKYNKNYCAIPWRPHHHMLRIIRQLKPDILHTHHPFYLGTIALKIAQQLSIPIVFTYHSVYTAYTHYIPLPQWFTRYLVTRKLIRFCRAVQGIIAPSNAIKVHIQAQGIQTFTTVIPSALQELFIAQKPSLHTPAQPFQLLCVGRLMGMVRDQHNIHLTLVGYGAEYDNLQAYAYQTLGLSYECVQFIHKPCKESLLTYYQHADLFLFPSYTDTQGIVLAESMSCGIPVLAVHGPGQEDIIINGYNGFLVKDKNEMVQKINTIMHDQQLYAHLQNGAFETSKQYYPAVVSKKLIDFYAYILANTY
jgi:1,2-diacylglycerol 3-alpha-glucosyltransferase